MALYPMHLPASCVLWLQKRSTVGRKSITFHLLPTLPSSAAGNREGKMRPRGRQATIILLVMLVTMTTCVYLFYEGILGSNVTRQLGSQSLTCVKQKEPPRLEEPAELTSLPTLSVTLFKHCDAYNELRNVKFVDPSLKHRLCTDSPAYTIVDGRFPLCQLKNNLPRQFYEIVNKTARIAPVQRAMHNSQIPVYTFSDQDMISRQMLQTRNWETDEIRKMLEIMKKLPKDSVTFMDIGSNLGLYSIQAREEGYPVVAVDANIRTLIRLQMTARNLGIMDERLKLFWCFLDEEVALKKMNWVALTHDCHIGGASSGSTNWVFKNPTMDTIPVMTAQADDLRRHIKTRNIVIKMDIESGEHMFMKTGVKLFDEFDIMALQMEFWRIQGTAPQTSPFYKFITNFMTSRNFSLLSLASLRVFSVESFKEWDGLWVRNDFVKQVAKP